MLAGEEIAGFDVIEADGGHFPDGLFPGHFVEGLDGDGGIFLAVLNEHDASARFEGAHDGGHHFAGV